ncbi:hypothetical protein D3C80_708230 [compost metagenome]
MAAVLRFDGERRETVVYAVAAVGLMPGKYFAQRRNRQLRQQSLDPGTGGDHDLTALKATFGGDHFDTALDRLHPRDRTIEQLAATGFFGKLDQAGNRLFRTQEPGIRFKHADVTFRCIEFRPALVNLFCAQKLCVKAEFLRAVLRIVDEFRLLWTHIQHAAVLKQFFAGLFYQRIP